MHTVPFRFCAVFAPASRANAVSKMTLSRGCPKRQSIKTQQVFVLAHGCPSHGCPLQAVDIWFGLSWAYHHRTWRNAFLVLDSGVFLTGKLMLDLTQSATASSSPRHAMVFDVESVGLHGEGFAVAWLVLDLQGGIVVEEEVHACPSDCAVGSLSDRAWVAANVPPLQMTCTCPAEVRAKFWAAWLRWRLQDTWLVADFAWPVETLFLSACVSEAGLDSYFSGPLPLVDVASLGLFLKRDLDEQCPRLANELPEHDPAADTRHTARKLQSLMALRPDFIGR